MSWRRAVFTGRAARLLTWEGRSRSRSRSRMMMMMRRKLMSKMKISRRNMRRMKRSRTSRRSWIKRIIRMNIRFRRRSRKEAGFEGAEGG